MKRSCHSVKISLFLMIEHKLLSTQIVCIEQMESLADLNFVLFSNALCTVKYVKHFLKMHFKKKITDIKFTSSHSSPRFHYRAYVSV